jgi:hypothetical protein
MPEDKRFVYVLKSGEPTPHFYVGLTSNVRAASPITTPAAAPTLNAIARGNCTSPSSFLMSGEQLPSSAI